MSVKNRQSVVDQNILGDINLDPEEGKENQSFLE